MQGQQVFYWVGPALYTKNDKVYYQSFQLNGLSYTIGKTRDAGDDRSQMGLWELSD